MISETLKTITENFEKGFHSSTLIGWEPNFDEKGRPLNANPNLRDGSATIEGKTYWYVRWGWTVRIWDRKADYVDVLSKKNDFIEEVNLTPKYLLNKKNIRVKCIKNSIDSKSIQMPWIKVGKIYEVVGKHWSRKDYFAIKGEGGCIAFYRKSWFQEI